MSLRLAQRILLGGELSSSDDQRDDFVLRSIIAGPVVAIDEVAEYWVYHGCAETILKELPSVKPPFPSAFVEWNMPTLPGSQFKFRSVGVALGDAYGVHADNERAVGNTAFAFRVIAMTRGDRLCRLLFGMLVLAPDGNLSAIKISFKDQAGSMLDSAEIIEIVKIGRQYFGPCLMAFAFMHCKNVTRAEAPELSPSSKWLRRMRQPELKYHTINIDPMKQVLRTEGGIETNGLKKALHICRGHFATYTDDKPLFGRSVGTFWKPAHARGSMSEGVVMKDYNVKAPL